MVRSFNTGISGLNSHQAKLDVVSNNIANMNTLGYKSRQVHFADLFYETIRPATNPNSTTIGGTNPAQIGSGVKISQIDTNLSQGVLEQTSSSLDLALSGGGFFVVNDGTNNLYTRAGAFGLDAQNRLVDKSTGYRVMRFGAIGEPDGSGFSFQTPGDDGIVVPLGANVPGQETTQLQISGNLDALAPGEQPERLISQSPFIDGTTSSAATSATLLNDLSSNIDDYAAGDELTITGRDADGSNVSVTMSVDDTTTVGDLITFIDSAFALSTASLDSNGNIVLEADSPGEASLQLVINDSSASGQVGLTDWPSHSMLVQQEGQTNYTVSNRVRIYDMRGSAHDMTLTFERVANNVWNMTASLDPSSGVIIDGDVQQITFDNRGLNPQVLGTGTGDIDISFQINGVSVPQSVTLNFGKLGELGGLTQVGSDTDIKYAQDGYEPGVITGVEVNSDGVLIAVASNDERFEVAQLAIAAFRNPAGLTSVGNSYFAESANSGIAQLGPGATGERGEVTGYHLEASNVDIAREFTQLIIAQRGFSANARTITATDEILEELINIVR